MLVTQSCLTLWTPWTIQSRNSPGQNTGVGSHSLFQGIFPTQGSNLGLPHYRQFLYHLSHHKVIFKGIPTWAIPRFFGLWSESESEICSVVSNSLRPCGLDSLWNSLSLNTGVGNLFLPHSSIVPKSTALDVDSLPVEPPGSSASQSWFISGPITSLKVIWLT